LEESVTVIGTLHLPAWEGVPQIAPAVPQVDPKGSSVMPPGKTPPAPKANVYGAAPPVALSGNVV
jgi:hypothetical protein